MQDLGPLPERKLKEIEHSKIRRNILRGFERVADTHMSSQVKDLESLVMDKDQFDYHFSNMKYYSITQASERFKHKWLSLRSKPNVHILDFACGNGENGIYSAQHGAKVTGIDISPDGIQNANENAASVGVSDLCQFVAMDGESMTFPDNTFDYGVEYGALHHVELPIALAELSRVLKPGAQMICVEALRHNPLIHAYRKRTPHLRTEWEVDHILGVESIRIMRNYFNTISVRYFHLISLALVPFRKSSLFPVLLPLFDKLDALILSLPFIRRFAWIMIVELSDPIK